MLPKAHLTSHSRMSGSRWVNTLSWLSGSWRSFLYSSFVYSCHLFLTASASVSSIPFLSFIVVIFAWNVPLVSLIFLKRSLVFSILLFSSISLHWSLRNTFLSVLAILWNSAFRWVYPSFSPLPLASLGNYSQPSANLLHSQDIYSSACSNCNLASPNCNLASPWRPCCCFPCNPRVVTFSATALILQAREGDLDLTTISSFSSSLCASPQEKNPYGL